MADGIDVSKLNRPVRSMPVQPARAKNILTREIVLFGHVLRDKKKEDFYSELHALLSSGFDLKSALELVEEEQQKEKDKACFQSIKNLVIAGKNLSEALRQSGQFTPYECFSVRIGEETGRLNEVFCELHSFYTGKIKQRRQMLGALTYPAVVFLVALGAVVFMLKCMIPLFADAFKRFGGELPALTRVLIDISAVFTAYFYAGIFVMLLCAALVYSQQKKEWYRKLSATILGKIPVIGAMVYTIYMTRFCHSMSLLLSAKISLPESLILVQQMVGFYPIETSLPAIHASILKGVSLHKSMEQFPVYNRRMVSLIRMAEEVNQLDRMFDRMAKQYSDEIAHQSSLIGSLLEPVIIIFLGAIVAIVLIAMYLPMFRLGMQVR